MKRLRGIVRDGGERSDRLDGTIRQEAPPGHTEGGYGKAVIIDDLPIEIDLDMLLTLSGYSEARPAPKRLVDAAARMIEVGRRLSKPAAVYEVHEVADDTAGKVRLGRAQFSGKILKTVLTGSELAAVYAATLGPGLDAEAARLTAEGDVLSSVLLDTIGSLILTRSAVSFVGRVLDTEARPRKYAVTAPFGPGQCQWDLAEQRLLFDLIDPSQIGVALTDTFLMIPKKSVSGIIGIGPADRVFDRSPCQVCNRKECPGRQMVEYGGVRP
jgi:hypothetical protein